MSSYSEYLNRKMQRTPKIVDTRPHRDAGHQTEVVKRLAASAVQESRTPASACVMVLDGPSTRVTSRYAKAHTVQDVPVYTEFTAGQAVAEGDLAINRKAPQIQQTCYTASTIPELNDRLRTNPTLARIQSQKNQFQRGWNSASCCRVCGEPAQFADSCACNLTVTQQRQLPTSGSQPRVPS